MKIIAQSFFPQEGEDLQQWLEFWVKEMGLIAGMLEKC
jgi:hypothetical protein